MSGSSGETMTRIGLFSRSSAIFRGMTIYVTVRLRGKRCALSNGMGWIKITSDKQGPSATKEPPSHLVEGMVARGATKYRQDRHGYWVFDGPNFLGYARIDKYSAVST
jgi:hypothetical protein